MKNKLAKTLKVDDDNKISFRLAMLECAGSLVLMSHWMRGIIDALVQNNNIQLTTEQKANWDRVIADLSLYEEFLWEVLPSRGMVLQLREFRKTGQLQEGFEALMLKDDHGRVPYKLDEQTLDDIEDIIRRLKDARQTATPYGHATNLLNVGRQIN